MPAAFPAQVISPDRVLFDGEAEMVVCRTEVGEIAFLAGHVPLVGALDLCRVKVVLPEGHGDATREASFAVKGGFVEVRGNRVVVLSDVAFPVGEIGAGTVEEAREAQETSTEDEGSASRESRWLGLLEELSRG